MEELNNLELEDLNAELEKNPNFDKCKL